MDKKINKWDIRKSGVLRYEVYEDTKYPPPPTPTFVSSKLSERALFEKKIIVLWYVFYFMILHHMINCFVVVTMLKSCFP